MASKRILQSSSSPPSPVQGNWWTKAVNCPYLSSTDEFKELTANVWASRKGGDMVKRAVSWVMIGGKATNGL